MSQLRAAVVSDEGAMMHRELRVTLTNDGASACVIDGFPAVRLLDASRPFLLTLSASTPPR